MNSYSGMSLSFSDLLDRLADRDARFDRGFGQLAHIDFASSLAELDARLDDAFRPER